jgi:4-amino-4-deoxychorismate lyase
MSSHVLAILNQPSADAPPEQPGAAPFRFVDPDQPHLAMTDFGATRGDGIFETISVGDGYPQAFEHHLTRFARSAASLELPTPDHGAWHATVLAVVAELDPAPESWVKLVLTRGIEGSNRPTGWAYGAHAGDFRHQRTEGIRVVMLDRGYRHDIEQTSPWLLAGAKTLSYAINRAAVREAARRDADDVIFVSADGIVLEGPTSTVVFRRADMLISPGTGLGILDGTTQANIFRYAQSLGMKTAFELATPDMLRAADAAWLVSSVRLAAPVRELDGAPMRVDTALTAGINEYLRALRD